MQLVDAIRQAAKNPTPVASAPTVASPPASSATAGSVPIHVEAPTPPSPTVFGGNIVRLELFLNPDQLTTLLRGVIGSTHSVMTLREAAKYVRVTVADLELLAEQHQVPGFRLEGKWRFPKAALDEWLAVRSMGGLNEHAEEEEENADGS